MSILDFLPGPTDWRFVTSSGGDISFGLAEFLNVGAAVGELHVREDDGLVIQLRYVGLKGGVGVGLSILGPVSGSFSLAKFEAGGIGRIYKGPAAGARLSINDMIGPFYMVTFGLNFVPGGIGVSVVFMGLPFPFAVNLTTAALLLAKGAGVFWGMLGSSSGGIEAYATSGTILAAFCGGVEVAGD